MWWLWLCSISNNGGVSTPRNVVATCARCARLEERLFDENPIEAHRWLVVEVGPEVDVNDGAGVDVDYRPQFALCAGYREVCEAKRERESTSLAAELRNQSVNAPRRAPFTRKHSSV